MSTKFNGYLTMKFFNLGLFILILLKILIYLEAQLRQFILPRHNICCMTFILNNYIIHFYFLF
jgi:hypothetical protein